MRGAGRAAVLAAASAAAAVVLPVAGALAHEEVPGAITVFDRAVPELPAGVRVEIARSAADQLVLSNDTAEDVDVLADAGEPFLRVGPAGTFANLASPTWYAAQLPEPSGAAPPAGAVSGPSTPPRWSKVTDARAVGWFDHRLHPQPLSVPPAAEPGVPLRLGEWRVPLRVGGRPVELAGHRQFTRLAGSVAATVNPGPLAGTGVSVTAASGRVPALVLDAAGAVGSGTVTVFGEGGEPMLRFSSSGTEANGASPTWGLTAAARGRAAATTAGPGPVASDPAWQRIAESPTVSWLEPRAAYQPGVPPPEVQRSRSPVGLGTWTVPLEVGGRRLAVAGTISWIPDPALLTSPEERGAAWPAVAAAGGIGAAVAGGAVLAGIRRRRRR